MLGKVILWGFLQLLPEPLARILHEGNEAQGKSGKQGWLSEFFL